MLWEVSDDASESDILEALHVHFGTDNHRLSYKQQLYALRRKPGQSLQELHNELRKIMTLAYPKNYGEVLNDVGLTAFIKAAFDDANMTRRLRDMHPTSMKQALALAEEMETFEIDVTALEQCKARLMKPDASNRRSGASFKTDRSLCWRRKIVM